ncbi:hypothetical protein FPOAC2_13435 [Fusarium poae]
MYPLICKRSFTGQDIRRCFSQPSESDEDNESALQQFDAISRAQIWPAIRKDANLSKAWAVIGMP